MRHVTFLLFLFFPFFGSAQGPHPILRSFSAVKQPNGVLLKWIIKGGEQCQGTKVYRADDSYFFEELNRIPGVCGSTTADEEYAFFDSVPFPNSNNHYRLELGFQGFSDTVTAFFEDFGSDDHLLITDAQHDRYRVLFNNDRNLKATLKVFDVSGKLIYEDAGIRHDFEFSPAGWNADVYIFRISGVSASDIHGKIYFSGR